MMLSIFLSLLLIFLSRNCVQSGAVLTQPEAETGHPEGPLRLTCKTSEFNFVSHRMHWVRQVPGQGLEWLVYYYASSRNDYTLAIKERFTASKDITKSIFILDMKSLKIEDTAIYYCARDWGGSLHYWGQETMVTVTAVNGSRILT
ncbi:Ig heavy chain V region [Rhincodon typus]|uniref:Ig heavy chain V region n=1 Tax=Rhincodon typus TaxID=259920 RepID=UPI00202DCE96|nr:Ig heavy chain V region [Rhincodon typus]